VSAPVETVHQVTTADGLRLHALVASPPSPTGVFILCHGLTTNCDEHGQFRSLRDRAVRSGFAVVRFDFRAHGASDGSNEDFRLSGLRTDADAIVELVQERFGLGLPVFALGVSFGGAPATHIMTSPLACAGLAIWYAVVDYQWNYAEDTTVWFTAQMRAARSDTDPSWSGLPVPGTSYHLPAGLLEEVASDPTYSTLRALSQPVLAYYGSRDRLVDVEPMRRLAAERRNVELRIAHGAAHGFILWRPWVVSRTVAWARRIIQSGP
jgi:uncharacterized protein